MISGENLINGGKLKKEDKPVWSGAVITPTTGLNSGKLKKKDKPVWSGAVITPTTGLIQV
jgi:hypothetical protein